MRKCLRLHRAQGMQRHHIEERPPRTVPAFSRSPRPTTNIAGCFWDRMLLKDPFFEPIIIAFLQYMIVPANCRTAATSVKRIAHMMSAWPLFSFIQITYDVKGQMLPSGMLDALQGGVTGSVGGGTGLLPCSETTRRPFPDARLSPAPTPVRRSPNTGGRQTPTALWEDMERR